MTGISSSSFGEGQTWKNVTSSRSIGVTYTKNQKDTLIIVGTEVLIKVKEELNEVRNLKVTDIDSTEMKIIIKNGKGKKDRHTLLAKNII